MLFAGIRKSIVLFSSLICALTVAPEAWAVGSRNTPTVHVLPLRSSVTSVVNKTSAAAPVRRISFVNDVVPALTRIGCNQGTCHGGASGKGGFKLSLRGYAPELDYAAMTRQARGRRICLAQPEQSLILRKPLLELPHRGGAVLHRGTPEFLILLRWLQEGAPGPNPHDPHVVGLTVTPAARILPPHATLKLHVTARFSDGSVRDVTYWTRFGSNDENTATVQKDGTVRMQGAGETAITVGYQDKVAMARVAVPYPNPTKTADYTRLPRRNYIDTLTDAKLAALHLWPSRLTTDAEFARRLYLDLIGTLPTPEEIKAFQNDRDPHKRDKLADTLMRRPEFTDCWTYIWCDLLRVNRGMLKDKGMWAFYAYVRDCVARNKPWDKMAREVLTATGNTFLDGPANYFRTALQPEEMAENISQGFLGIRVQCAHCHNHPMEKWTQNEYYGMANLFARVRRKADYDPWVNDEMIVSNAPTGDVIQPRLARPVPPKPLGGPALALDSRQDRRAYFADWLTRPDNWFFSHEIVNRVWAHFMGRGLVEPVDDLRETNPPTNPALFDALASDFVKHGFDLRYLMRRIVTSRTYQLASEANARNRQDDRYYSRYLVKRLTAEQLLDALSQVTGQPEAFPGMPTGYRALQLPDTHVKSDFLDSFGRPARQITCECERSQEPSMAQALLFINSDTVNRKVTADGGLVDRLIKAGKSDADILDTLYWTTLGRAPAPGERAAGFAALRQYLAAPAAPANTGSPNKVDFSARRRHAFEDMLWVLVNSKEFLFNH
jgi:hypothetical protein